MFTKLTVETRESKNFFLVFHLLMHLLLVFFLCLCVVVSENAHKCSRPAKKDEKSLGHDECYKKTNNKPIPI